MPTPAKQAERAERSAVTAGQRRINFIWETTQAMIAVSVIGTTLLVDALVALRGIQLTEVTTSAQTQLNVMAALVTGFYFGRTNHTRTGGVGAHRTDTER